jgi:uncharacterized alpha/beta hydrolase family protein
MGGLRALLAMASVVAVVVGCGGQQTSPDLFEVHRTGSIPGANLTIVVNDDGTVRCNGKLPVRMPDDKLIEARTLAGDLASDLSKPRAEVPKVSPVYTYSLMMGAGKADWMDGSLGLPASFYRLALFTRQVAKGTCGLVR